MDSLVARLNIEHYRKALANERDETKRQTLIRLIGEEERKLTKALHEAAAQSKARAFGLQLRPSVSEDTRDIRVT